MRYATAVGHLRKVVEACVEDAARPPLDGGEEPAPYVLGAYAFGELLEAPDDPGFSEVALVVDAGVDELPWGYEPPSLQWFAHWSRMDRHPMRWVARPRDQPVSNHMVRRPLRLWTVNDGVDEAALTALAERRAVEHRLEDPPPDELRAALERELAVTEAALDDAVERYWDRDFRDEHRGGGRYPEHTLWELAWGVRDLRRGLEQLAGEARPGGATRG